MSDGTEFGWNDEIEGEVRILLQPAVGTFTIKGLDRATVQNGKYANQRMAVVKLAVKTAEGSAGIQERFILNSDFGWKIHKLFFACGLAPEDGKFRMDWTGLEGKTGNCEVGQRTYEGKNGPTTINEIKEWLAPGDIKQPEVAAVAAVEEDDF